MSEEGIITCSLPTEGELVIGRDADCDVHLGGFGVSRRHAALRLGVHQVEIVDLGSRNGTLLGDRRLTPNEPTPFVVGTTAKVGDAVLMLQASTAPPAAARFSNRPAFEARVDREILSSQRRRTSLALAKVVVAPARGRAAAEGAPVANASPERVLAEALRPVDLLAVVSPREFEMVLVDTTSNAMEAATARIRQKLAAAGYAATIGVAVCPEDGATRDVLEQTAAGRVGASAVTPVSNVDDAALKRIVPVLERVAGGMINVLVLGETGVGKEVLAHAIHRMSPRATAPIVCINCCALSDTLLESELFGHERGAFTGAVRAKVGLLEAAQGGTVFLDEVGEMSLALQAKLLRVLEQKEVTRVGALRAQPIDIRIVAATNRDLELEAEAGRFRRDLYFRLCGVSVVVPPLRDRVDEIEPLALGFVERAWRVSPSAAPTISPAALAALKAYSWPGNIRELRNVMERAVLLCTGGEIQVEHLPLEQLARRPQAPPPTASPAPATGQQPALRRESPAALDPVGVDGGPLTKEQERARVVEALRLSRGNQTRAAELLQMSRRTLVSRLEEFDLPRPRKQT